MSNLASNHFNGFNQMGFMEVIKIIFEKEKQNQK